MFLHHIFKFIHTKLGTPPLLGDVDPLGAGELAVAPRTSATGSCSADELDDLVSVDLGHWALGLSKGATQTRLEPPLGTAG